MHCSSCYISEDRALEGKKIQDEDLCGLTLGSCVATRGPERNEAHDEEVSGRVVRTLSWWEADPRGGGVRDPHTEVGRCTPARKGGRSQLAWTRLQAQGRWEGRVEGRLESHRRDAD